MTQCILLTMQSFYLQRSKDFSVLLSTRVKSVTITLQENQRLNLGNQYERNAT